MKTQKELIKQFAKEKNVLISDVSAMEEEFIIWLKTAQEERIDIPRQRNKDTTIKAEKMEWISIGWNEIQFKIPKEYNHQLIKEFEIIIKKQIEEAKLQQHNEDLKMFEEDRKLLCHQTDLIIKGIKEEDKRKVEELKREVRENWIINCDFDKLVDRTFSLQEDGK